MNVGVFPQFVNAGALPLFMDVGALPQFMNVGALPTMQLRGRTGTRAIGGRQKQRRWGEKFWGRRRLIHAASLALVLSAVWLLLSGHTEVLLLTLGAASVFCVVLIALRMDVVDHEGQPVHLGWRLVTYIPWLAWEIIKANWDVARRIVDPKLPISPTLTSVPSTQKTDLGQVLFANSITLTPGTVSVRLMPGEILIHALSEDGAADLIEGRMDRRVSRVENAKADNDGGAA